MKWFIKLMNTECPEHPDYRIDWNEKCNILGKCNYEKCPLRNDK